MQHLDALRDTFPEAAKDLRLNLQSVLTSEHLNADQTWGVALTSAFFIGEPRLRDAVLADAQLAGIGEAVIDDARAAAALMAMNTIYYRFRHMVAKESYSQRPARLRMSRMAKPATSKGDFELFALAVAVLAGCEACVQAHEASILQHGLGEEHVHDTVRIAAVIRGAATALTL